MTRIKISIGIILALISISIFSGVWVNKSCDVFLSYISEIQDNPENAGEYARILEKKWESFRKTACILILNEKLDDAEEICSELPFMNNSDEITAAAEKLEHIIKNIKESEYPHILNIL